MRNVLPGLLPLILLAGIVASGLVGYVTRPSDLAASAAIEQESMDEGFPSQHGYPQPQSRNGITANTSIRPGGMIPVDFLILPDRATC